MTFKLDKKLPTSITFDPVVRAKYKTKRDYYYHEDPVYRQAVKKQHASYMKDYYLKNPIRALKYKESLKKSNSTSTLSKEQYERNKKYNRNRYQKNKEVFQIRGKEQYQKRPFIGKKPKLSDGLELREESF